MVMTVLTRTSLSAIRSLLYLGSLQRAEPVPPRKIALALGESPSYLAKIAGQLAKTGILQAHRGIRGGVMLARRPEAITLLAVFEACQGNVVRSFCSRESSPTNTCSFHQAGLELFKAITRVLSKWTIADLLRKPFPLKGTSAIPCWIESGMVPPKTAADRGSARRRQTRHAGKHSSHTGKGY
jgi:Rrf2 family protein